MKNKKDMDAQDRQVHPRPRERSECNMMNELNEFPTNLYQTIKYKHLYVLRVLFL